MISAEPPSSYVVQKDDTLSGIAEKFYGNVDVWPEICADNKPLIQDCNTIQPGWRLKLPSRHSSGKVAETTGYVARHASGQLSGTLSCSGLEQLWTNAGGSVGARFTAAEIAMAESGGNQYATGQAGERGYWQINPDHGSLSTYDPTGNAHAAIVISSDGTNWSAWTTYTSGLYIGRC